MLLALGCSNGGLHISKMQSPTFPSAPKVLGGLVVTFFELELGFAMKANPKVLGHLLVVTGHPMIRSFALPHFSKRILEFAEGAQIDFWAGHLSLQASMPTTVMLS